jgi:hypothetical protein
VQGAKGSIADGGEGNDIVVGQGTESVTTVGGLGRDVIYNTSAGGILWGDVAGSYLRKRDGARVYIQDGTEHVIADDKTNRDVFYFAKDTKIPDAQKTDVLTERGAQRSSDRRSADLLRAVPVASAANDNDARREATFRFDRWCV